MTRLLALVRWEGRLLHSMLPCFLFLSPLLLFYLFTFFGFFQVHAPGLFCPRLFSVPPSVNQPLLSFFHWWAFFRLFSYSFFLYSAPLSPLLIGGNIALGLDWLVPILFFLSQSAIPKPLPLEKTTLASWGLLGFLLLSPHVLVLWGCVNTQVPPSPSSETLLQKTTSTAVDMTWILAHACFPTPVFVRLSLPSR